MADSDLVLEEVDSLVTTPVVSDLDETDVGSGDMRTERTLITPSESLIDIYPYPTTLNFSDTKEMLTLPLSVPPLTMYTLPSTSRLSPTEPTPMALAPVLTPARPPVYHGRPDENVANWCAVIDRAVQLMPQETSDDYKLAVVATYLHDDAAGLLANNPSLKSWAQLKTFLLERSGGVALTLQELFSLRQQGTVHAHYDAVLALCARVPGMTEAEATRWFVSGLAPEFSVELEGFNWEKATPVLALTRLKAKVGNRTPTTTLAAVAVPQQSSSAARVRHLESILKANHLCLECGGRYQAGHRCLLSRESKKSAHYVGSFFSFAAALLTVVGTLSGQHVRFLVDTGASENFVSRQLHARLGSPSLSRVDCKIKLADGSHLPAQGQLRLPLVVRGVSRSTGFTVADISFDGILGLPWLSESGAVIDCKDGSLSFAQQIPRSAPAPVVKEPWCSVLAATALPSTLEDAETVCLLSVESIDGSVSDPALKKLVLEFADVFPASLPLKLPPDRGASFRIVLTPDSRPAVRPMRRFSPKDMESLTKEISGLLEAGLIRPSDSPFGAQVLFVEKKDGSRRMCVDYRSLNESTVGDAYPLPLIDELFDRLASARVFTKLDLRSGYHQLKMEPSDAHKTAFRTPLGSFEFLVLPFGLKNAPSAFVRMIDKVFPPTQFKSFLGPYIDDLLIFSPDQQSHLDHCRRVFTRLREEQLYVKGSKCVFGAPEVEFLGFLVGAHGIRSDPVKIEPIMKLPSPLNVTEVRSFLGMINYFQRFIKGCASFAGVLSSLLKKGVPFVWTPDHEGAFISLKKSLASTAVLRPFDLRLPIIVQTDASNLGLGAVLLQGAPGSLRPVAFASRKLSGAELNYTTQEKEALAMVYALSKWEHYLGGVRFSLETDHKSLIYLKTSAKPSDRLTRWFGLLARFDYEPIYRQGLSNVVADHLSRQHPEPVLSQITAVAPDPALLEDIKKGYEADPYFGPVFKVLVNGEAPLAKFKSRISRFRAVDGLLYFADRLSVPDLKPVKTTLLKEAHATPVAGHFGAEPTYLTLTRRFFWPRMAGSVTKFVAACQECQKSKHPPWSMAAPLRNLETPSRPWESVGMDLITGLPVSEGFDAIVTVVDRFSKMVHFIPAKKTVTAQETADLFIRNVFRLHGMPMSIVSDRDPRFTSDFWKALFDKLGTKLSMSTADHPQTDGQAERANGVIIQLLRTFCHESPATWRALLPMLEFAVNNKPQASTGVSPFVCCGKFDPRVPLDLLAPADAALPPLLRSLPAIHRLVSDNLTAAQDRQAAHANESRREIIYNVGDKVWLRSDHSVPSTSVSDHNKLRELYTGPYSIKKVLPNAVELQLPPTMHIHPVINVSKVKPAVEPWERADEPGPVLEEGEDVYEVERILKSKTTKRQGLQYLVRWKGYDSTHDRWLPERELEDAPEIVAEFLSR